MDMNFTNIDINKIIPHPDNPRKDLGDLTELAESIKARGILQNLTVIPHGTDHWVVVIGHRRLAASKLAGLTEVPCALSNMDHREQVATMLLENIQRSDLTPIEQAHGFQMMMDLGDSVTGISEKTGFSDSTIRKRLNLVKLDQVKLQESYNRGGTLMDYAKLEQLTSDKAKNSVLESIGTRDFEVSLRKAVDDQEKPERKRLLLQVLDTFATKVKSANDVKSGFVFEKYFYDFKMNDWKKPKDADTSEYCYMIEKDAVELYKKTKNVISTKISAKQQEFNKREAKLNKLSKLAYELRYGFVQNFSAGKKYAKEINDFAFKQMLRYGNQDTDMFIKMFAIKLPDTENMDYQTKLETKRDLILGKYHESPELATLKVTYVLSGDSPSSYYHPRGWENRIVHVENKNLDFIYDALISLGYELSTEEQQLRDGSHELFDKN